MRKFTFLLGTLGFLLAAAPAFAQTPAPTNTPTMTVDEYEPRSTLVVPQHPLTRAKYPFIDVHTHYDAIMPREKLDQLVAELDRINLQVAVNLSGSTGSKLAAGVKNMKGAYPKRFVIFANLSYQGIDEADYGQKAAARLEEDVRNGAQGLKIFKEHGLDIKDGKGARVPANDPRFDPIWEKCAELHIPVVIHTGEPKQFFEPQDRFNERWLELKQFPRRARPPSRYPSWEQIMGEQHDLFAKHPKTKFITAHLGWLGGDLGRLGQVLDTHPSDRDGVEVGYALYKRKFGAEGKLDTIVLYQCVVRKVEREKQPIFGSALHHLFGPLNQAATRMTHNLSKSNDLLIAMLLESGFTPFVEQVHMARTLVR